MELKLGDVQTTALIPLAVKASETLRKKPRVRDKKRSCRHGSTVNG